MKIVGAKVLNDFFVEFELSDGRKITRDFSLLSVYPAFKEVWSNRRKFRRLRVVDGVPTWPGDCDFSPEGILWGHAPSGKIPKHAIVGDHELLPMVGVKDL